jgi:hypothetical protein
MRDYFHARVTVSPLVADSDRRKAQISPVNASAMPATTSALHCSFNIQLKLASGGNLVDGSSRSKPVLAACPHIIGKSIFHRSTVLSGLDSTPLKSYT